MLDKESNRNQFQGCKHKQHVYTQAVDIIEKACPLVLKFGLRPPKNQDALNMISNTIGPEI